MHRWTVWGTTALLFLVVNIHRFAVGTIAPELMASFQLTALGLGTLSSLYFYLYAALQVPTGVLADAWGPRRVLTASALVLAIGSAVFGLAPSLGAVYAGRILIGLGVGGIFVNLLKLQAAWFPPAVFATMTGLTAVIGNLGSVLAGSPLAWASAVIGWRGAFVGLGALTLGLALLSWLLVQDTPAGNLARGSSAGSVGKVLPILRRRTTWQPLLVKAGLDGAFFAFFALLGVSYFTQVHGLTKASAAAYLSIGLVGFGLGGPTVGFWSDRLGRRRLPLAWSTGIVAACWTALVCTGAHLPPAPVTGSVIFLMGAFSSSLLLNLTIAKEASPAQAVGIATGIVNAGGFAGAAVTQMLVGFVLDRSWTGAMREGIRLYLVAGYRTAFAICLGIVLGALFLTLLMGEGRPQPAEPDGLGSPGRDAQGGV